MFSNYVKIALRRLFRTDRSPIYTWINIGGLTIGLTSFLLIGHYIHYQLSYDRFYPNFRNIYRLVVERIERGEVTMQSAKTYAGIGNILCAKLPEVTQFVRILDEECMFQYEPENVVFNRQRTFWADGNFYEFFNLKMIMEGQLDLLYQPNQTIISHSAAERFFGTDWTGESNPIGKTVILNGSIPFMIQGIFEDIPANSHINVDFVVSYSTLMALLGDYMNTIMPPQRNFVYNYIMVKSSSTINESEQKINRIIAEHTGRLNDQESFYFSMQPLTSIHLNSHLSDELNPNGNKFFIWALSIAAVLIIVVAWINFINLTIARALNRSKEVGVRKSIGASKKQLAFQFAIETLFSGLLALVVTVLISFFSRNLYNQFAEITFPLLDLENGKLWFIFILVFLVGAGLASIYPSLVLSSFDPIKVLKGKNILSIGNGYFRQGLITFQFSIAILLIACTGAVYYQIENMRKQNLGVDLNQVLVLHSPRSMIANQERAMLFNRFRDNLEQESDIITVASGGCIPGKKFLIHSEDIHVEGKEIDVSWSFDVASVDERFLPTLGLKILSGRNFEFRPDEVNKVILNESAFHTLGFQFPEEAVGQFIRIAQFEPQEIVGVVADAHFEGLHEKIKPLLLTYGHDYEFGFFPIKITSNDIPGTINKVATQWKAIYPRDPFDYFFLDRFFDGQYKDDQIFGQLFGTFALLTIFISGLGLFGLISLTTYQKSKEIGIRKVFGAGIFSIITLLTKDFLKLVLIAAIVAIPLSYLVIYHWLQSFAYRFNPAAWMYILPVFLLLITSLIAISGQTVKSALKNPVDAIAEE